MSLEPLRSLFSFSPQSSSASRFTAGTSPMVFLLDQEFEHGGAGWFGHAVFEFAPKMLDVFACNTPVHLGPHATTALDLLTPYSSKKSMTAGYAFQFCGISFPQKEAAVEAWMYRHAAASTNIPASAAQQLPVLPRLREKRHG